MDLLPGLTDLFKQWIAQYGLLGIFLAALISNASILLPIPYILLVYGLGGSFNPLLVGLFAGVGAGLGELTGYLVGYGIEKRVHIGKREGKRIKVLRKLLAKHGIAIIIALAFLPIPFDILGIICGMLKYDWKKFLIGTTIGRVILNTVVAFAGFYSFRMILESIREGERMGFILLGLIILIFLLFVKFAEQKWKELENYG